MRTPLRRALRTARDDLKMAEPLNEYLEFATSLSKEAGRVTLEYFGKEIDIERKEDESPVTVADRETELFIRKAIQEKYPDHGILGEEFGEANAGSSYMWVLDPIDGTKSFIHGIPLYTVLIALLIDGEPVVGVIHNPPLRETAAAAAGLGCTFNGQRCTVSARAEMSEARVQVTDPADLMQRYPRFAGRLFESVKFSRTWGDGYGYLLVASGRAEIMIDPVLHPWDVAPLKVVVSEAGGLLSDFAGRSPKLAESAIASNEALHSRVLQMLE